MTSNAATGDIIRTVDLTMVYQSGKVEVVALRDVNLRIESGEFVAIMGPSGCGKSTLLHLLGGLIQPSGGQILIEGMDISRMTDAERTAMRRKKIGYVFQRFNLLPTISAKANIELAKKIHGNGHLNANGSSRIIDMLGLTDKIDFRPTELSGGEQQRVSLARALLLDPKILLLDEPTANLDPNSTQIIERAVASRRGDDSIILLATHNLGQAKRLADVVIHMHEGKIVEGAPTKELFNNPQSELTRKFTRGELEI
jgi:putative ABC transport system ATP-binding protein